jgi:type II secretory pathway pseudopilin PulG
MNVETRTLRLSDEEGYLMVALIVAMSVMAIMMSAALPAWHTMMRREKEAELVFRGEQYARAIGLYQRKFANAPVPSIDELVEQRFLRKKYKDPIANADFVEVRPGTELPGQPSAPTGPTTQGQRPQSAQTSAASQSALAAQAAAARARALSTSQGRAGGTNAGIVGVTSKSTEKSLRLYNGRGAYNEWVFMPVQQAARAGGPAGAAGARGAGAGRAGAPVTPQGQGQGRGQGNNPGRGGFESRPILPGRGATPTDSGRGGRGPTTPNQGAVTRQP